MVEKILNNTTPYGKIRASHEGSLHYLKWRSYTSRFQYRKFQRKGPSLQISCILINKLSKTSLLTCFTTYDIKLIYYMNKILQNLLISIHTCISATFDY